MGLVSASAYMEVAYLVDPTSCSTDTMLRFSSMDASGTVTRDAGLRQYQHHDPTSGKASSRATKSGTSETGQTFWISAGVSPSSGNAR